MANTNFKKLSALIREDANTEARLSIEIAVRIHQLMSERNMTRAELAQQMGETCIEINHWFSGMHTFTTKTLAKLQEVFGQPIIAVDKGFDSRGMVIY